MRCAQTKQEGRKSPSGKAGTPGAGPGSRPDFKRWATGSCVREANGFRAYEGEPRFSSFFLLESPCLFSISRSTGEIRFDRGGRRAGRKASPQRISTPFFCLSVQRIANRYGLIAEAGRGCDRRRSLSRRNQGSLRKVANSRMIDDRTALRICGDERNLPSATFALFGF